MKIKMKTSLGSRDFPELPFVEDREYEVTELVGFKLVGLNLAIDITPAPQPVVPAPVSEPLPEPEPKQEQPVVPAPQPVHFKSKKEK